MAKLQPETIDSPKCLKSSDPSPHFKKNEIIAIACKVIYCPISLLVGVLRFSQALSSFKIS